MKAFALSLILLTGLFANANWHQKLMTAIEINDPAVVKKVLDEGGNPNFEFEQSKNWKTTPLIEAAGDCQEEIVDLLVQYKAQVDFGIRTYDRGYYDGDRYPFARGISCSESLLRKLFFPKLMTERLAGGRSFEALVLSHQEFSVEFLDYIVKQGFEAEKSSALHYSVRNNRKDWFDYFMKMSWDLDRVGILAYAVGKGPVAEPFVDDLLKAGANPDKVGSCELDIERGYDQPWRTGTALQCSLAITGKLPIWFIKKFSNKTFDFEYKSESLWGWQCRPEFFENYMEMFTNSQIHLKNPQEVFGHLIFITLKKESQIIHCEDQYPYLSRLMEYRGKEIDVRKINDFHGYYFHPFSDLLQRFGPNKWAPILVKYGAEFDVYTWIFAKNDVVKTEFILSLGAKFEEGFFDKYLQDYHIDPVYLDYLLKKGLKIKDSKSVFNFVGRATYQWEEYKKYFDQVVSQIPREELAKLSLKAIMSGVSEEFQKKDENFINFADRLIKAGLTPSSFVLSDFCSSFNRMKWANSKKVQNDSVAIKCMLETDMVNYLKIIDAGLGSMAEEKDCQTPLKKFVFGRNYLDPKPYQVALQDLVKRKAKLEVPVCGRTVMDEYFENLPDRWQYQLPGLLSVKGWTLKGAKYAPNLAKMLFKGIDVSTALALIDRGASMDQGLEIKNPFQGTVGVHPVGYIAFRESDLLLKKFIEAKVDLEKPVYFDGRNDYVSLPIHLARMKKSWASTTLENLFKSGHFKSYISERLQSVILESERFPMNLVAIRKPTSAELRTLIYDKSFLMHFSAKGDLEAVKKLLELGSEINQKNSNNQTALDYALSYGKAEVAKYLVSQGGQRGGS